MASTIAERAGRSDDGRIDTPQPLPYARVVFGIGMPELVVILVVALVVLGPKRLPELARTLGKAMAEFRRQTSDIMDEFNVQAMLDENERRSATPKPHPPEAPTAPASSAAPAKPDAGTA
jgi:sec-independent protein translocase protein TatB